MFLCGGPAVLSVFRACFVVAWLLGCGRVPRRFSPPRCLDCMCFANVLCFARCAALIKQGSQRDPKVKSNSDNDFEKIYTLEQQIFALNQFSITKSDDDDDESQDI